LPDVSIPKRITITEIKAFLRSIFVIGLFSKERFEYWKLLVWSFFKKRKYIPLIVSLMISGFHFRKIAEKISKREVLLPNEKSLFSEKFGTKSG